jgi:hypothetical protein
MVRGLFKGEVLMRLSLLAAFALVLTLGFVARAEDKKEGDSKDVSMTGVLIDSMCADKMAAKDDAQKAAEEHKKACALKCGKDGSYVLMSEGKITKLSDDSKAKVEEYLNKEDSKTTAKIEGTKKEDGSIEVKKIEAAEKA